MSTYNQTVKAQHVRVGNWFEEIKLKEDTGIRFYPDPTNRQTSLLTKSRCIEHTDQITPKDYTTVTRATLVDPRAFAAKEKKVETMGPRRKLLESTIKQSIEEELARKEKSEFNESRRLSYLTSTKESFTKSNFAASLKENDINVRLPTKNANYTTENAVTYYSHAVKDPRVQVTFPTTFVGSTNPFRKNCYYSADIRSTMYNIRSEIEERPQPLPTVEQFKILSLLVQGLLDVTRKELEKSTGSYPLPGVAVRYLINILYSTGQETLSIHELETTLANYLPNFEFRASEKKAMLAAFDARSDGNIVLQDFIFFIKRTPSPRRLELLEFFFSALRPDPQSGVVAIDELQRKVTEARLSPKHYVHEFLRYLTRETAESFPEFDINEFFDYHIDASTEIDTDDNFEAFLKESWDFL